MPKTAILKAMKEAASRTYDWRAMYGVFALWEVNKDGLKLSITSDKHTVTRLVSWIAIEQSRTPDQRFREAEAAALQAVGISE